MSKGAIVVGYEKEKRDKVTDIILQAKKEKGFTFEDLAEAIGRHPVWTAAAIMGQAQMDKDEAEKIGSMLELDESVVETLQDFPSRGALDETVPVDPLIYRFYEIIQVYGKPMKAIIHEKFGDGIMSAIDFSMDIERKEDPNGDRVVITLDGKFLPTKKW